MKEKERLQRIYRESRLKDPYTTWSFLHRFFIFQWERVPLPLLLLISFALTVGIAHLLGTIHWLQVITATSISVLYLLQIRLSDEPKDYEHDTKYYPKRPVQRGVITLTELLRVRQLVVIIFLLLAAGTTSFSVIVLSVILQGYAFLTRKEFYLRDWLRKHFLLYQYSHYIQLLILDWLILTVLSVTSLSEKIACFFFIIFMIAMIESTRTIGGVDVDTHDRYAQRLGVSLALLSFVGISIFAIASGYYLTVSHGKRFNGFILVLPLLVVGYAIFQYLKRPTDKSAQLLQGGSLLLLLANSLCMVSS